MKPQTTGLIFWACLLGMLLCMVAYHDYCQWENDQKTVERISAQKRIETMKRLQFGVYYKRLEPLDEKKSDAPHR